MMNEHDHDCAGRPFEQEALRRSDAKYRRLYESMMDAFVSVDMSGFVQEYNEVYRKMLGYEPEELLRLRYVDVTPEKWHAFEEEIVRTQILSRGYSDPYEKEYRRKDGTVFPVELRTFLLTDNDGRPCAMWAIVRDISERKRSEEALKRAHAELEARVKERTAELARTNEELRIFRMFAEASGQGFGMADLDGYIVYWNPALCRLFGEDRPENAIGRHVTSYYPEEYFEKRQNEILPTLLRDGHWQGEVVIYSPQGKATSILQNTFLIGDEDGRPVRLGATITDITELKRTERELRQSEEKYRALVETSPDAVVMTELTGRVTFASRRTLEMYGAESVEELLGRGSLDFVAPGDHDRFVANIRRTIEEGVTRNIEYRFLKKNGERIDGEVSAAVIKDSSGKANALVAILRDVTERHQVQEALRRESRTLAHLLQATDHERQLIAYEIHDGLAQCLTGAIMQFQMCKHLRETNPVEAEKAFDAGLAMVHESLAEARRLISGVRPPILDELGVVAAIAHLVCDCRAHEGPQIDFHSEVAFDRLDPVLENAIYRITQEGLTNACKHSKSRKVRVELVQHVDQVRIEIRDRGIGFEPKSIDESRFGLEGIRERARLLGGSALVESSPGKGTRIVVDLPLVGRG